MSSPTSLSSSCSTLDIPFPTPRLASVAHRALCVDKELSPLVRRSFSTEEKTLRVVYEASTNRMLRVAVNSFMDSLHLVVEVMEELDVDVPGAGQGWVRKKCQVASWVCFGPGYHGRRYSHSPQFSGSRAK